MRLATTCCTSTSASVLKSCANRLRLASASHFSWTNMDNSLGLDRHRRAMLAAASDATSAQPTRQRDGRADSGVAADMLQPRTPGIVCGSRARYDYTGNKRRRRRSRAPKINHGAAEGRRYRRVRRTRGDGERRGGDGKQRTRAIIL